MKLSQLIAQFLHKANVEVCTHVPGFGGTEVFAEIQSLYARSHLPISFHEEVAYGIAYGAALAGTRSACFMKTHGIPKAGNAILHSMYAGINAGLVNFVFEDKQGTHSDNILEIEPILEGMRLPFLRLGHTDSPSLIKEAYLRSEQSKLPYTILVDCEEVHKEVQEIIESETLPSSPPYQRGKLEYLVCPPTSAYTYPLLKARLKGDWLFVPDTPSIPLIPDGLPDPARQSAKKYQAFFDCFRQIRGSSLVAGDTSLSTLYGFAPYHCIDTVIYMGGSLPIAIGLQLASKSTCWALTGDFGFISAGQLGLIEAKQRQLPLKVVIFHNQIAGATGGQPVNSEILWDTLASYEEHIIKTKSTQDSQVMLEILESISKSNQFQILVLEYSK
ncbi:MAG: thiamine pyrophosphate-dependent enzyme [Candidatus Caenarcaniphilales bacterium]|nr:thiamine pyrophosphate-dependent enzyme [Candidatus Caenarcaniphilales bacterium]